MKNFRRSATTIAGTVLLGAAWLAAAGAAGAATPASGQRILSYSDLVKLAEPTEKQLEAAKRATQKYRDVNVAVAEGFVQGSPQVPGEGFHYLNPKRLDCNFDPAHPEVLLYAFLHGSTRLRLVGVEYAIPYACMPQTGRPPRGFAGTLDVWSNEEPVPFWTVEAWLYLTNPEGIFASDNPLVP